jgi:hypothetical protein
MKYDNKKESKQIFGTKKKPVIFELPEMRVLAIQGTGNPNSEPFQKNIEAMYPVMYVAKFAYKKNPTDDTFDDFVVAPLMGWWTISEEAVQRGSWTKEDFVYELRMMIPFFVTDELMMESIEAAKAKKGLAEMEHLEIKTIPAMKVGQILHVGSYDDEPETFVTLEKYIAENGLTRKNKNHVEIYLSDARRTEPEKLKTILQVEVEET